MEHFFLLKSIIKSINVLMIITNRGFNFFFLKIIQKFIISLAQHDISRWLKNCNNKFFIKMRKALHNLYLIFWFRKHGYSSHWVKLLKKQHETEKLFSLQQLNFLLLLRVLPIHSRRAVFMFWCLSWKESCLSSIEACNETC